MTTKAKEKKYWREESEYFFKPKKKCLRFFLVQPNRIKEIIIMLTFFQKEIFALWKKMVIFPPRGEKSADAFFVKNLRFTEYPNKF